jgi:hypothetical protein
MTRKRPFFLGSRELIPDTSTPPSNPAREVMVSWLSNLQGAEEGGE